ncbi:hypothetical protein LINPERHAP1_LOCUS22056, partial [Linum perenne]
FLPAPWAVWCLSRSTNPPSSELSASWLNLMIHKIDAHLRNYYSSKKRNTTRGEKSWWI